MEFIIKDFDLLTTRELFEIVRLRQAVFMLEQRVECEDIDLVDLDCVHLMCRCDGATVGYLRIVPPSVVYTEASIGRVAVLEAWRHKGVARRMMEAAMERVAELWGGDIRISSQEYVVPFYQSLGFEVVSERYFEAGIAHFKMLRRG